MKKTILFLPLVFVASTIQGALENSPHFPLAGHEITLHNKKYTLTEDGTQKAIEDILQANFEENDQAHFYFNDLSFLYWLHLYNDTNVLLLNSFKKHENKLQTLLQATSDTIARFKIRTSLKNLRGLMRYGLEYKDNDLNVPLPETENITYPASVMPFLKHIHNDMLKRLGALENAEQDHWQIFNQALKKTAEMTATRGETSFYLTAVNVHPPMKLIYKDNKLMATLKKINRWTSFFGTVIGIPVLLAAITITIKECMSEEKTTEHN